MPFTSLGSRLLSSWRFFQSVSLPFSLTCSPSTLWHYSQVSTGPLSAGKQKWLFRGKRANSTRIGEHRESFLRLNPPAAIYAFHCCWVGCYMTNPFMGHTPGLVVLTKCSGESAPRYHVEVEWIGWVGDCFFSVYGHPQLFGDQCWAKPAKHG